MQRIDALDYTFPEGFPADAEDLVACLLIEEPSERLGARDFAELKGDENARELFSLCFGGLGEISAPKENHTKEKQVIRVHPLIAEQ